MRINYTYTGVVHQSFFESLTKLIPLLMPRALYWWERLRAVVNCWFTQCTESLLIALAGLTFLHNQVCPQRSMAAGSGWLWWTLSMKKFRDYESLKLCRHGTRLLLQRKEFMKEENLFKCFHVELSFWTQRTETGFHYLCGKLIPSSNNFAFYNVYSQRVQSSGTVVSVPNGNEWGLEWIFTSAIKRILEYNHDYNLIAQIIFSILYY